jgi:hypothetical protein
MRCRLLVVLGICCIASWVVVGEAADPLQSRVSIDYRDAPAADVIRALAAADGLTVDIGAGQLRPVTITLTNVKLGTALTAVCENASCVWDLKQVLKVTPIASEKRLSLPPMVSFEVHDVPPRDVFRALAIALDVPLTIEVAFSNEPTSFRVSRAATSDALTLLCRFNRCQWTFDPERGLRVLAKP